MEKEQIESQLRGFRERWFFLFGEYPAQEEVIAYAEERIQEKEQGLLNTFFNMLDVQDLHKLKGMAVQGLGDKKPKLGAIIDKDPVEKKRFIKLG